MDRDMGDLKAGFRVQLKLIEAISRTQSEHTAQLRELRQDVQGLREGQQGLRQDVQSLREGQQGLRQDVQSLREGQQGLRQDVQGLREGQQGLRQDVQSLREGQQSLREDMQDLREKVLVGVELINHKLDRLVTGET